MLQSRPVVNFMAVMSFFVFCNILQAQKPTWFCIKSVDVSSMLDSIGNRFGVDFSFSPSLFHPDSLVSACGTFDDASEIVFSIIDTAAIEVVRIDRQFIFKAREGNDDLAPFKISGKVCENGSNVPLQWVHVVVEGTMVGTVTNDNGEFVLFLPPTESGASISFSLIGYESESVRLTAGNKPLQISLIPINIRLPEVKIVYSKADDVIAGFFKNYSDNYSGESSLLSGFFRESIFRDKKLIQISEASVEVSKSSYADHDTYEKVRFVKGRKSRPPDVITDMVFKLEGGPYYLSRLDVAKYLDFLPRNGKDVVYSFDFDGVDYEYGRMLVKLAFKPIRDDGDLKYTGWLFFDSESFALVRAEFELTRKSLVGSRRMLIKRESRNVDSRLSAARYVVTYRPVGGKWLLGSATGVIQIKIKNRNLGFSGVFTASSELVVNDSKPVKRVGAYITDTFRPHYQMYDQIKEFDPGFWDSCNIVLPDVGGLK